MTEYLTIGELARSVGVRTSALRFYESKGLLMPHSRTPSGYRLFAPDTILRLRMIQRAQRLGFSLEEIRQLLAGWETGNLNEQTLVSIAENRYLALEKQVTERLVLQHELELFLQDLDRRAHGKSPNLSAFDRLLERVCADPTTKSSANYMLNWLLEQAGCNLATPAGRQILDELRGRHIHIWQEEDAYHTLFVSDEPRVAQALQALAALEADCETHADARTHFADGEEGYLFIASGENAFIFGRLFLALGAGLEI